MDVLDPMRAEAAPSEPPRETLLVYRHRLVPRSEANFLRRFYVGFERLSPVWIGCRTDDGVSELTSRPLLLGRAGPLGVIDRARFRQLGTLPPYPDLRALRPRLVHAHFGRGGALALPIARSLGIPLVVTFHGGDATKDKHYRRHLLPRIFERRLIPLQREAALIVCVSEFVRGCLIQRGFPPEKLEVIHQGVDVEDGRHDDSGTTDPYFLFVGRLVEKKGLVHLIEAMRLIESRGARLRLVVIGDGSLSGTLKERAKAVKGVSFHGWLSNPAVRGLMRGATAVCVPSVTAASGDSEGLPTVVLEAMAEGVPVVASRHPGIGEAVEHERTGFLVPPSNPAALADALQRLAAAPEIGHRMGRNARMAVLEKFDALRQSRRLEEALLRVLGEPGR